MAGNEEVKVSEEMTAALCAAEAVRMTEGIYGLVSNITDTISEKVRKKPSDTAGIRVSAEKNKVSVDMQVEVEHGVKIPAAAWKLQENVKKQIENKTGYKVESVNVHVQKIHFEAEVESGGK